MVRRLTGERRVGHAGTLDPAATGVLPVCFGQGTRVVEFLVDATKAYRAEIELGVTTDTYDASGKIVRWGDASGVSRQQLASALSAFSGSIWQTPPMYSAVKHQGKRLYQLARAGIAVEPRRRLAKVHHLELTDWQPPVATVEVVCGKGTYIRSLAYDLGESLGCGAHLKSLVRLRCGLFDIEDAVSVIQLEDAFRYGYWRHLVYPIDSVLLDWTAVVVGDDTGRSLRNGRPLALEDSHFERAMPTGGFSEDRCRVYALDGRFIGVLRFNPVNRQWRPEKVFL